MGIKISGYVGVTHTYSNNGKFEYDIEDLGYSEEEFLELSEKEKEKFIEEILETGVSNVLDSGLVGRNINETI